MPTITTRALRGSAVAAIAAIGALGLAACSGGGDAPEEEPTTSATTEQSPAETSATPAETEAAAADGMCSAEQVSALTGSEIPEGALAGASATFEPASLLGDLPTTCVITLEAASMSASYAVLPGGAATVDALVANSGGQAQNAGGTLVGTVDDITVAGGPFTTIAQGTTGFENPDDLIVVVASPSLGG